MRKLIVEKKLEFSSDLLREKENFTLMILSMRHSKGLKCVTARTHSHACLLTAEKKKKKLMLMH